jgi:hypothetical protein
MARGTQSAERTMMTPTRRTAERLIPLIDAGLVAGLGEPVPGQMCAEAAVCFALDLPHEDRPPCVSPAVRALVVVLNDANWTDPATRARGMKRLAIAQIGTADTIDDDDFAASVVRMAIRTILPTALRHFSRFVERIPAMAYEAAALRCEKDADGASFTNAVKVANWFKTPGPPSVGPCLIFDSVSRSLLNAFNIVRSGVKRDNGATAVRNIKAIEETYAAVLDTANIFEPRDILFSAFAENVVQILIKLNAPGAAWLDLAPPETAA